MKESMNWWEADASLGSADVELDAEAVEVPLEVSLLSLDEEVELGVEAELPSVDEAVDEVEEPVDVPVEVAVENPDDDLVEVPDVDDE